MLSFLKHWGKSNMKKAANETRKTIARLDSEGFTDAVIGEMIEGLEVLGLELSKIRVRANKEHQEYVDIQATYDQRVTAAKLLKKQLDEGDSSKESALGKMLDLLDRTKVTVAKEKQEDEFWANHLSVIETRYNDAAGELKTAKSQISQATASMEQSEIKEEQAKLQQEQAKRTAGLSSKMSSLSVALGALDDAANEAEAKASSATMAADALSGMESSADDAEIAAAMAAVSGKGAGASMDDRMAGL